MTCRSMAVVSMAAALSAATALFAQQPSITIDGDNVRVRGCVTPVKGYPASPPDLLVWSRSDIMLVTALTEGARSPADAASRVFYWLEDDEDLSKHVGQLVEIKGELEDFQRGEMQIKRDGGFTEVQLDLGGKSEKIRVPTTWLGPAASEESREFQIVGRRIDVEDVTVVGACNR